VAVKAVDEEAGWLGAVRIDHKVERVGVLFLGDVLVNGVETVNDVANRRMPP